MVVTEEKLEDQLEAELSGWQQIAILGIGNEFNGDDSLGVGAAKMLKKALLNIDGVEVLASGTCPENFTGLLRRLSPTHVLLIDAVESREKAGTIRLVNSNEIEEVMPSTHSLPLYMLVKYIEQELGAKAVVLGIQPKNLDFGTGLSTEVENSIGELVHVVKEIIVSSHEKENEEPARV